MKPLHRGRFLAPALVLATAASCTGNDVTTPVSQGTTRMSATSRVALAEQVARTEIAAASRGDDSRGIESVILRMEGEVPGIGGLFYDTSTSRMVVYVQEDSQRERPAGGN